MTEVAPAWAKSRHDDAYIRLSLVDHCIDVAAVSEALLQHLPIVRVRLGALAERPLSEVDIARLHPRVCGGNAGSRMLEELLAGPSPRVRGKHQGGEIAWDEDDPSLTRKYSRMKVSSSSDRLCMMKPASPPCVPISGHAALGRCHVLARYQLPDESYTHLVKVTLYA